jgi:hypothetical protein
VQFGIFDGSQCLDDLLLGDGGHPFSVATNG